MVSAIASASSSSEYSWSESRLKSGDLNSSRLRVLKCLLDGQNFSKISEFCPDQYDTPYSIGMWIRRINQLNEYDVLDRKLDTPVSDGSGYRIQLSTRTLNMAYPLPSDTAYPVLCPIQRIHPNRLIWHDSILSSNNTTSDSFFKPYLKSCGKSDTEKEDEQSQTKRKYRNTSSSIDEKPNKRRCKAEKFEAIRYSLGPHEEYIAIRIIMEYLVNISKRRTFWSLNEDILKITILKTNMPYPSRKIRRIRACTHQRPLRNKAQYAVSRRPICRIENME
ncbi:hypothetical protein Tco_0941079 [Tanacetum coccineum]|uniref:Uncharacterized protein n=1 Tax=Tanacetum coccineum TaxID=301880 RepID=A0ABQ5DWH6_9ASTR